MATRTTITLAQRIKLTDLIREQYVSSGLNDDDFARLVSEKIGCTIKGSHVWNQRCALEIPNNFQRSKAQKPVETSIDGLQARVARLEKALCASLAILTLKDSQFRPVLASMDPAQDDL